MKKRESWQDKAQTARHVAEAIERVIRPLPEGGALDLIWQAMEASGISREVFDRAIEVLTTQGRMRKIKDRLYPPARE